MKWFFEEGNFKNYLQDDKGLSALKNVVYEPSDEGAAADYKILQEEVSYVTDTFMVDESSAWRTYKDNEYRDYIKRAVSGELSAKDARTVGGEEFQVADSELVDPHVVVLVDPRDRDRKSTRLNSSHT